MAARSQGADDHALDDRPVIRLAASSERPSGGDGLDGLASSAYGPEAALAVVIALGATGIAYLGSVMLPILALLGINASLLAAAALMID